VFPDEQRWNIIHGAVDFPAQLGSSRMTCRVSEEALEDYFGATTTDTMVATFRTNRGTFEDIARRKLLAGEFAEGVVLITTKDFAKQ